MSRPPSPDSFALREEIDAALASRRDYDAWSQELQQALAQTQRRKTVLAVAYLDLGDVATARDLLNEVAAGHDATARDEALQLLRDIG